MWRGKEVGYTICIKRAAHGRVPVIRVAGGEWRVGKLRKIYINIQEEKISLQHLPCPEYKAIEQQWHQVKYFWLSLSFHSNREDSDRVIGKGGRSEHTWRSQACPFSECSSSTPTTHKMPLQEKFLLRFILDLLHQYIKRKVYTPLSHKDMTLVTLAYSYFNFALRNHGHLTKFQVSIWPIWVLYPFTFEDNILPKSELWKFFWGRKGLEFSVLFSFVFLVCFLLFPTIGPIEWQLSCP